MNLVQVGILLQVVAGVIFGLNYLVPDRWLLAANQFLVSVLKRPSRSLQRLVSTAIFLIIAIFFVMLINKIAESETLMGYLSSIPWFVILINKIAEVSVNIYLCEATAAGFGFILYLIFLLIVRELLEAVDEFPKIILIVTTSTMILFSVAIALIVLLYPTHTSLIQGFIGALLATSFVPLITFLAQLLRFFTLLPRGVLGGMGVSLFIIGNIIAFIEAG